MLNERIIKPLNLKNTGLNDGKKQLANSAAGYTMKNNAAAKADAEHDVAREKCDEMKGKAKDLKGKAKEGVGEATGDERMENEGRADQAEGRRPRRPAAFVEQQRAVRLAVKRRMLELQPEWDEGPLGFSKFSRFLRQAHDDEVIDLSRAGSGNYEVALPAGGKRLPPPALTAAVADQRPARASSPFRRR